MASPVLQFKRGAFENLPGLRAGEPALTTDTYDLYVGIDSTTNSNKFFGSHRYWEKEDATTSLRLKLVDKGGSNSINLKSPDTLSGITTYTFPSVPVAGEFLKVDADGNLSWASDFAEIDVEELFAGDATFGGNVAFTTTTVSTDPTTGGVVVTGGLGVGGDVNIGEDLGVTGIGTFGGAVTIYDDTQSTDKDTGALVLEGGLGVEKNANIGGDFRVVGIVTFADTTDNTLGDENTGAVQIDGGMGIAKNLTVKQNLHVGGYSEFVGVVTFKGGTINLGDEDTDDIVFGGEIKSNLTPTDDAAYDIGIGGKRWRNANFSGVSTFNNVTVGGATTALLVRGDTRITGILTVGEASVTLSGVNNEIAGITTFSDFTNFQDGVNIDGQTELDNVNISGVSTFTGTIDGNGGADISGGETTLSSATVSDLTAGRVVLAGTSGSLEDSANLTFGAGGLTVGAGGVNVTGVSTFSTDVVVGRDLRLNGNDIQASDGSTNITLTSNTLTTFAGDIKVTGNDIQASDGNVNITMTSNTLTEVKGDLKVTGNDIQSSAGVVAITLADNDVTVADDLTVQGNLYVNGSTTQVNTNSLTVEDRTIDLGIVNGATPASATTWDLGILFNYNSSGAKKSAVIWEHADTRFKFASVLGADTEGTDANTPQLTVTTFAPIEIGALWVNDCAGASQVISCTGTTRNLENITVDAGTF